MDSQISETKKYRLGNQSKEYELVTQYLGWSPEDMSWDDWCDLRLFSDSSEIIPLTIWNPAKTENVELVMIQALVKDAFPMSFYGEDRAINWRRFYKVTTRDNPNVEFVIPLH